MDRRQIGGKWLLLALLAMGACCLTLSAAHAQSPSTSPALTQSAVDQAQIPQGIHLVAAAKGEEIYLTWSSELSGIAHFKIERSEHEADEYTDLKTVSHNVVQYTDSGMEAGKDFDYRIEALDSNARVIGVSSLVTSRIAKTLIEALKGNAPLKIEDFEAIEFWRNSILTFIFDTLKFIPKLFVAIILFGIFWLIYRMVRRIVVGSMSKAHVDASIRDMLGTLIKWSIMGFGLVIACNQVGIEIAALLTGVSIIGLAIGLSAQETLANFIAGVVIFWDKPFKVGDWIIIDGTFGKVLRVSFRSTRMLDPGGETIVFPNTYMLASRVANHSTHPHIRVEIPIGIAYKESIDKARAALLQTVQDDPRICSKPPTQVVVAECGDSSVNLLFRLWITDASVEKNIFYEYLEKAKKALDAAHIEIPFPHMQLFVESTDAIKTLAGNPGPVTP